MQPAAGGEQFQSSVCVGIPNRESSLRCYLLGSMISHSSEEPGTTAFHRGYLLTVLDWLKLHQAELLADGDL